MGMKPAHGSDPVSTLGLQKAIERQVLLATWRRVRDLRVEVSDARVVIHGRTASYYVKQLILEAAFDVLGPAGSFAVELDVQVEPAGRRGGAEDDELWGVPGSETPPSFRSNDDGPTSR